MFHHKGVCKICRRKKNNLSYKGYCPECAIKKVKAVGAQMKEKRGYYYRRWRKAMREWAKTL